MTRSQHLSRAFRGGHLRAGFAMQHIVPEFQEGADCQQRGLKGLLRTAGRPRKGDFPAPRPYTVETHRTHIMQKLDGAVDLVPYAVRKKIIAFSRPRPSAIGEKRSSSQIYET